MIDTMYKEEGVGLAGPQVGVLRKIFVVDVGEGPYVMINPVLSDPEGEEVMDEGCLSYPGLTGAVARPTQITVEYTNLDGERKKAICTDLFARCVCHENDHLNGVVYTDLVQEGTMVVDENFEDFYHTTGASDMKDYVKRGLLE